MKTLTIFTPTYNRGYILPKLYDCLCKQTCLDFVWLVVDDGSTDNTHELITEWKNENKIEIQYFYQQNGGKMRAHNRGVKECKTPLFFCVDSDDSIFTNTVDRIVEEYKKLIERKDFEKLCGFLAKRHMKNKVTHHMPNVESSTMTDIYKGGFKGETSIVFRTDIISLFPFPEIPGEKFVPESYSYNQIDQKYKYLIYDESWIICEYLDDGYSFNWEKNYRENPKGWAMQYHQNYRFFAKTIRTKYEMMSKYISFSLDAKINIFTIVLKSPSVLFCIICLPFVYYKNCLLKSKK